MEAKNGNMRNRYQYAAHNYAGLHFNLSNPNFENSISLIKKCTIVSGVISRRLIVEQEDLGIKKRFILTVFVTSFSG